MAKGKTINFTQVTLKLFKRDQKKLEVQVSCSITDKVIEGLELESWEEPRDWESGKSLTTVLAGGKFSLTPPMDAADSYAVEATIIRAHAFEVVRVQEEGKRGSKRTKLELHFKIDTKDEIDGKLGRWVSKLGTAKGKLQIAGTETESQEELPLQESQGELENQVADIAKGRRSAN